MLENELYQKIDLLRKCKNVRELSKNVKKFRNFQKPHRMSLANTLLLYHCNRKNITSNQVEKKLS